ncbi:MAG: hypothetical protein UY41_C0048G0002 [Candidatus Moranbacteria bacterium GW2011_GWE1_49_15]|nr:MAG: hypothetical protein UY41_C0048G0002 [Candidatus Moranbacteria bacterium GW2011_GWE1_49_15]HBP00647.1 hypothetical protein [Candidatus Moranbacteria bacterium]
MSLEDINKELYDKDAQPAKEEAGTGSPWGAAENGSSDQQAFQREDVWQKQQKGLTEQGKKKLKVALAVLGAIILLAGAITAFVVIRKNAFQEDRVEIVFDGPKDAESMEKVSYVISVRNGNRAKLGNVELVFNYSENFLPSETGNEGLRILSSGSSTIAVGEIGARQEKKIILEGAFYAPEDAPVYIKAKALYSPGSYTTRYELENQIGINIKSSPVFVDLTAPVSAMDGDNLSYVIDYKNLDVKPLENAQVRAIYPNGFEFVSAEPKPSEGSNVWHLGTFPAGGTGKIIIQGRITGSKGESKTVQALIGKIGPDGSVLAYNKREKVTAMTQSPLSVYQAAVNVEDGILDPGEEIRYVVRYKNSGDSLLRNVVINVELKSRVLDISKMRIAKGYYDSKSGMITWKSSEIPELANMPIGFEGEVAFSVPVLEILPVAGESDKNYSVYSVAKMDSTDILDPEGKNKVIMSNALDLKVNTKALLSVNGYRQDANIENFGPMPMMIGSETSFVVRWDLANVSNDISGAKVVASLPSGVKWTGKIYPTGEKISYDIRTNEIVWEIGDVPAGKGILNSKKSVAFQVSVVPQPNQVNQELRLINPSKLTAKDNFTESVITVEEKEKTTRLTEDKSIIPAHYKVNETP